MAIIRRKNFSVSGGQGASEIDLIDTPEKLLRFAALQDLGSIPLKVEAIAQEIGIIIEYCCIENELSGILSKNEDDKWIMQINRDHHTNRQRYTIAHELGHYCLHRHFKDNFEDDNFFRGGKTTKEEWQANEFAGAILIPEETFRETVRGGKRNVDDLARKFKVSTLALRIRAKNLGMTGHGL